MKREATADTIADRERASATPALRKVAVAEGARRFLEPEMGQTLREQQRWFLDVITTPEAEPAALDGASAARLVSPGPALSSFERLEIYRQAYHARLLECLADDYPVLQHALGADAFEVLCRAYVVAHPSRSPSLNGFGAAFAEFCRGQPLAEAGFAADLATLEWAIVTAIHAPTASGIAPDVVASVPPERWPLARLSANPSLQILTQAYPANAYFQAVRSGAAPALPSPSARSVAVYRTGRSVWRMELTPGFLALVEALSSGVLLGAALERVEPLLEGENDAERAQTLGNWFRHTVSSGLFSGLHLDS